MFTWLRKIFQAEARLEQAPAAVTYSASDPVGMYRDGQDALIGMEFIATLALTTPLRVLERHGEVYSGAPEDLPTYGTMAEGAWVPKVDWEGVRLTAPGGSKTASAVGPVPSDGGDFLPFLKRFRAIVESPADAETQIEQIRALVNSNPAYLAFAERLDPEFPAIWFSGQLQAIPGVGGKTAMAMFRAGALSLAYLDRMSADELRSIDGVGAGTVEKIRSYLADRAT